MSELTLQSALPLPNSNVTIPRLGFGVYSSRGDTCVKSCTAALKAGYRQIDSAQMYGNEAQVQKATSESPVPRSELFLTTKIYSPKGDAKGSYQSIVDSVEKIGGKGGYADLFLIHSPSSGSSGRKMLWQALEKAHEEGKAKAIGVSNFDGTAIEEMKSYAKVWPPHVNQIELHPWCQQRETVEYCKKNGIVIQAYCPLVRNQKANDQTLMLVAEKYKKSTGQVLIRYCLQKDWVPLPKSDTPSRIEGNTDVFDFDISDEDMKKLDDLDQGSKGAILQLARH